MVLSDGDRSEMHAAVVDYLRKHGMDAAAASVEESVASHGPFTDKATAIESKWSTMVRLNRALTAAEKKNRALTEEVETLRDPTKRAAQAGDTLPREPAKATFVGHTQTQTSVALSPIDSVLYSASDDGAVRMWDLSTKVCLATYKHAEAVSSIAVEPTLGRLLAVGCGDSAVRLYSDGECSMTLHGHDDAVSCVAWLPNASHTLVSVSREGGVRVWDAKRGAAKASKILDGYSRVVACGSSGLIAVGCDAMVHILRIGASELQAVKRIGPFSSTVQTVAFANTAADAIIAEAHGSAEAKEIVKAAAKAEKQGGDAPVTDPLYIAVGGRDRDVTVFDVSSGAKMFAFSDHENWVRQLAFSANGKHLLSCSDDSSIRAYDMATKRTARVIENAHDHFVTCLAAHPNIPLLASGSSVPDVKVWRCGL